MDARWLDRIVWTLIFGGLLVCCLGVFVERRDEALGLLLVWGGAAAATAGVILIGWRARLGRQQREGDER
ncbi:MAG TPA: hypothetical protein VNO84_11850 [Burkholderiaceae bacterium]|nr:hypothetical protein [Burkholderiaceae bacterium]